MEPNRRLAEVMRRADCTNKGLARRVADVAAAHGVEVGYSHVNVRRWLDGVQPRGMTPTFIAEALARKLGSPVSLADIGMQAADCLQLTAGSSYPAELAESIAAIAALVRADLSGSFAITTNIDASTWSDAMVRWLIAPDIALGPVDLACPDTSIEGVQLATTMFSQLDYKFGGGYARTSLMQYVDAEVAPLLAAKLDAQPPELLSAAAALLRLTGWTAYDTGRHGLAHGYLLQGLRLAEAAGDRALGGRILAGMSHQANFLGHFDHAVNLARAAQRGAAGAATPTAMALFNAMEARALAGRGDRKECEAALSRAERWLEQRVPENDPVWMRYFDEAELAAEFAHSYRDLGICDKAIQYAERAISLHGPIYVRSISFCKAVAAAGHLGAGEVDRGIALAEDAVSVISTLRSGRCNAYIRDFAKRLEPYRRHKAVTDFRTRADVVLAGVN